MDELTVNARLQSMSGLQPVGEDGYARCTFCGRLAVGPCARCHVPVCGNCCTLTEGGTRPYAICLECDRQGGHTLQTAWLTVLWWFLGPILLLAGLLLLIGMLFGR